MGHLWKFNSASQLQNVKHPKLIRRTKLQDTKPMEFSSELYLQGMKSSEVVPGTNLQKEKSLGLMPQPLWQDVKSFQLTSSKVHDRKLLQLNSAPQLQDRTLSMMTPEIHLEGLKPMALNLGAKLQDAKSESTNFKQRRSIMAQKCRLWKSLVWP